MRNCSSDIVDCSKEFSATQVNHSGLLACNACMVSRDQVLKSLLLRAFEVQGVVFTGVDSANSCFSFIKISFYQFPCCILNVGTQTNNLDDASHFFCLGIQSRKTIAL